MRSFITTFLLFALTIPALAQQQPLVFYYHGEALENGATITINAELNDLDELSCSTNPETAPANGLILRNVSGIAFSGTATLTITKRTMQPSLIQWCMGGQCVAINSDTFDKAITVPANGSIMAQLDAMPTQYGELQANITVFDGIRAQIVNVLFTYPAPDQLTFIRRSVIEEYTGTWCANCPRGIVGLQRLSEEYGDRCIPIAIHCGSSASEPMIIPTYPDLQPGTGIPACTIDRGEKLDPYRGSGTAYHCGIINDFAARLAEPTEAGVELSAQWNDEWLMDVRYDVTTTFNTNSDEAPYRLAFVLVEDGMKGTTSIWAQQNFFSTAAGYDDSRTYLDDDMKWWRDAPYRVTGIEYNHVAVNTLGIKAGIQGSITAPIVSGEAQHYSNTVTTLTAKLIQDKSRLSAVALLLNTETGRIVNAARADIKPYGADAINAITSEHPAAPLPCYDLHGRRISKPTKGLYIQNGKKMMK